MYTWFNPPYLHIPPSTVQIVTYFMHTIILPWRINTLTHASPQHSGTTRSADNHHRQHYLKKVCKQTQRLYTSTFEHTHFTPLRLQESSQGTVHWTSWNPQTSQTRHGDLPTEQPCPLKPGLHTHMSVGGTKGPEQRPFSPQVSRHRLSSLGQPFSPELMPSVALKCRS